MVDSVCTLLGHPSTCPHGRAIPPGACCRDGRTTVASQVLPLSSLSAGERGRIVYITPRDHHRMHRLTSLGLTPGTLVEVPGGGDVVAPGFTGSTTECCLVSCPEPSRTLVQAASSMPSPIATATAG